MTNSGKSNGRFKAEIYFDIDKETMGSTMQELDMPEEETSIETVRSYLDRELKWLADSGFYNLSVESITPEE